MKVRFTVPGEPVGKGRHRTTKTGRTYTPEKTAKYEKLVKRSYFEQCGNRFFDKDVALDLRMIAYFAIPKSASKVKQNLMRLHIIRPTKRPDNSNVLKAIEDGLNKSAYHDDSQIVDLMVRKFYSDNPRVVVTIKEAEKVSADG